MPLDTNPEPSEELKKATETMHNAMTALREVKADNAETKKKLAEVFEGYEKLNSSFGKQVAESQKQIADLVEEHKKAEERAKAGGKDAAEAKKRVEELEVKLATNSRREHEIDDNPHSIGSSACTVVAMHKARISQARQDPKYLACLDYLSKRLDQPPIETGVNTRDWAKLAFRGDDEVKTLRTDVDTGAGYLIPQVMDNEIRKLITEISPVRMFARTRTAPAKTMDVPVRTSLPQAQYEGENEVSPGGQSTYGNEQITLFRQTVSVPATYDMMVSSAFDLEREIASDVGESMGKGEGLNFILGSGNKCPQGIIVDKRIEIAQTSTSGKIVFNDIADLISRLKRGQAPWLFCNRRTLGALWQIQSTIGVPIWQPVAGGLPATIWGFPYNSDMIDLADAQTGSGAKPMFFADLRRGYEIFDMVGISVIRDDLTLKKQAITEWTFRRYNTGRVIIPEAIKILQIQ